MNVPRTAAQQVPPAAVGVDARSPPPVTTPAGAGTGTPCTRLVEPAPQTAGTQCRHLCLPTPRPSSSSRGVLLTVTQQDTVGDQGTATAPVHAGFPIALSVSLIFLPITDIVLVCAHMHSHRLIKSAVCCRHCNACPHCHCHTTSWPFRPFETMLEAGARHLCALKLM